MDATRLDPVVVDLVRQAAASDRYGDYLRNTLMDLLAINTAPTADLRATAAREGELFERIARAVVELVGSAATIERVSMNPAIANDPSYSLPGYAEDATGRVPPLEEVYAGRANLVVTLAGSGSAAEAGAEPRPGVILNAHADVVPPWFPPRSAGHRVYGRGACDAKAQIALLLAQMKLLGEVDERLGRKAARARVCQFVIDEAIGGNGSLSLVSEPRYAGVPVLMHECTDLIPHCAHPGVLWYRCRLSAGPGKATSAVELFPFVVLELEAEGRRLQDETRHPLFTRDHVQTNHGILGPYGNGPGTVCDHVAIEVLARASANPERIAMKMIEFMDDTLAQYVRAYGDKTRQPDPATGQPMLNRHFDVRALPRPDLVGFRIDFWGRGGSVSPAADCDNAITKAAYLLVALLRVAGGFPGVQATGRLADDPGDGREIVLEGSQCFTPTHTMSDIQTRLAAAAKRGARQYCKVRGRPYDEGMVEMTFRRLHSDAYADSPDVAPMQALRAAFDALGQPWPEPGAWETSCDARIYHHKGHQVAIFGAGQLHAAHSPEEYVDIPEVQKALAISTLATWLMIQ